MYRTEIEEWMREAEQAEQDHITIDCTIDEIESQSMGSVHSGYQRNVSING